MAIAAKAHHEFRSGAGHKPNSIACNRRAFFAREKFSFWIAQLRIFEGSNGGMGANRCAHDRSVRDQTGADLSVGSAFVSSALAGRRGWTVLGRAGGLLRAG